MTLPKRPRTSRIEDVNQRAFEDALGEFFIYRESRRDVGIDGQVEIFDGDTPTGLTFDVQLRATDSANISRARKVRVHNGHVEYWRSRLGPMLVVRYLASTGQLYVRWLHSYDHYNDGAPSDKTTPLPMRDEDFLDSPRRDRLVSEVAAFRRLQQSALQLPIAMRISAQSAKLSHAELLIALRRLNRTPDVMTVDARLGEADHLRFSVGDDYLAVMLAGVAGATIHLDAITDLALDDAARNLLALTALAFERVGQSTIAGRLAHVYLPDSVLAEDGDVVMALSSSMAHARQVREALDLADALDRLGGGASAHSYALTLVPLVHAGSLSLAESDLRIATLTARIKRRVSRGDRTGAASEAVGLGNALRHRNEFGKALSQFQKALRLDPAYAQRAHFHQERGGTLFLHGRYAEAAEAYERALELGASHFTLALYSDALLFAGRYAEAAGRVSAYLDNEDDNIRASEYVLKAVLCDELAARGLVRQARRTPRADKLADRAARADSHHAARDLAEAGLAADGLSSLAWFNLAISLRELHDPAAATAWLCAAVTMEWDPNVWAEALLTAGAREDLTTPLLLTARRMTSGDVFEALTTFAKENEMHEFLTRLPELIDSLPDDDREITVRSISENGVESIDLPSRTAPTRT